MNGMVMAMTSAVVWLVADKMTSSTLGAPMVPYWNAVMLLAEFAVVVVLVTERKTSRMALEAEVKQRTLELTDANRELTRSREALVNTLTEL